jgi:hypothetical protein
MSDDSPLGKTSSTRKTAMTTRLKEQAVAIDEARGRIGEAMRKHSNGEASVADVNRAFRNEAEAQARFNEIAGGRVPDDR